MTEGLLVVRLPAPVVLAGAAFVEEVILVCGVEETAVGILAVVFAPGVVLDVGFGGMLAAALKI